MSQPNTLTSNVTTTASLATRATCAEFSAATTCAPRPKLTLEALDLTDGARFTDAYGRWLRLIGYDSGATIDQHPDIV
jgi:hypothetical protein